MTQGYFILALLSFFRPLKGLHLKFHFTALGSLTQSIALIFSKTFHLKTVFQSGVE